MSTSISSSEISRFLTDVESNIGHDDSTDLKKLTLFLFAFTNTQLASLATSLPFPSSLSRPQSSEDLTQRAPLLLHLFSTLELVLSKKLYLLNEQLSHADVDPIFNPQSFSSTISLYDWALQFALLHIPGLWDDFLVLNRLKSFIITLFNLVSTKLHNLRAIAKARAAAISILEDRVSWLLSHLSECHLSHFRDSACVAAQFFSILNDHDISSKLLLTLTAFQLKLENLTRRLRFVIDKCQNINELDPFANALRSLILLSLTSNIFLDDCVLTNKLNNLSTWLVDLLGSLDQYLEDLDTSSLHHTVCFCLLRLLGFSMKRHIAHAFVSGSNLGRYLDRIDELDQTKTPLKVKTLHLIRYHCNVAMNNSQIVNEYQTSSHSRYLLTPFEDSELEAVRIDLKGISESNSRYTETCQLLHFEGFTIAMKDCATRNLISTPTFSFKDWIVNVRNMVSNNFGPGTSEPYALFTLLAALGNFACLFSLRYNFDCHECIDCNSSGGMGKSYSSIRPLRKSVNESAEMKILYNDILLKMLSLEKVNSIKSSPLLQCALLNTVYKVFASFTPPDGDISRDPIFQFVASSLSKNNNRNVRLAASRILPLWLIAPKTRAVDANFTAMFAHLVSIDFTSNGRLHFAESTINAMVELAIVSQGEWLCAVMIKLIYLLGESNDQHVNYVYCGCITIAAAKSRTSYKLLSPFLPSTAEVVIKKPLMLARVTQLLGISKKLLLSRTREYTVPRLLEYYKHDFIQEIADASNLSKASLVAKSLPRILAFYLVQNTSVNERYILSVLTNVNPSYKNAKLGELVSAVGAITWYILLHIQFDERTNKIMNEENINCALNYVARVSKRDLTGRTTIKDHLAEHVLELVQRFSENVHHIRGTTPYLEKIGSLRVIEFLINNYATVIVTALGQISSCLQASLENPDFQVLALKCWNGMVQHLPPNNLISLIDIIISLIFQRFETFEATSKELASQILQKIYNGLKDKFSRFSLYYLSLPFISHIQDYLPIREFRNVRQLSSHSIILEFTRRLRTSNKYVVQQALCDLQNYCEKYQLNCQTDWFHDPALEPIINDLVREIFDTASKFRLRSENISTSCAMVLARIGSLDPNKFSFKSIRHQIIILHDFKDFRENADFLVDLIETMVLKTFWASNDPLKQLFSAYAMQNFLLIMRLDKKVLTPLSQDYLINVWNKFSDVAKSTLTPLLSSKYLALESRMEQLEFPCFKVGVRYETWLMDVTSNMLKRPLTSVFDEDRASKKADIFLTCAKLIRDEDVSLCQYLLKYSALSHIINGNASAVQDIKEEFLNILRTDMASIQSDRIESIKACLQTVLDVLDYFHAWLSTAVQYINNYELEAAELSRMKKHLKLAESFLSCIPMDLIATKLADCDSYERTILYLEKCYRDGKVKLDHHLGDLNVVATLQSMYSSIDDYDALNGVLKIFSTNNLAEKLATFQYNENWSLAQESFKVMGASGPDKVACSTKLLKSLSAHGLYEDALSTLAAKTNERDLNKIPLDWAFLGLQTSAYQGDKQQICKWLTITDSIGHPQDLESAISYELAGGIKHLFDGNKLKFQSASDSMYRKMGAALVPSVSSSFSRNNNLMNQLHALFDMLLIVKTDPSLPSRKESEQILNARLSNVDQNFDLMFKILSLHLVTNKTINETEEMSKLYLRCSALARENGRLDISQRFIIRAMVLHDREANIEYARLLWAKGNLTEAIKSLSDIINENKFADPIAKANAQLTYAEWLDTLNHSSALAIINEYTKAVSLYPEWEKPYYDLGVYYSKIMASTKDMLGYYERQTLRNFFKALAVGTLYIYEALPKSITIWLDLAQRKNRTREAERSLNQIVEDLNTCINTMPVYVWYTAVTQILSRIVHEHQKLYEKLATIVVLIVKAYPRHLLWYVLSHANSNDVSRKDRIRNVLAKAKSSSLSLASITEGALELFDALIAIASHKIPRNLRHKRLSLARDFNLTNLSKPYTALVIPVASNLAIRIPSAVNTKFNAFPRQASVTFDGFDDAVNIFVSLQMPRQVTVRGLDLRPYRLMVKRDDTRKDAKVVEFTTMINRLLLTSAEARRRNLNISNYAVVPLTEDMGVIEFVTDVQTMKLVVTEQRRHMGKSTNERKIYTKLDEAQRKYKSSKPSDPALLAQLTEVFEKICKENAPVLHNWYIDHFSDPAAWYLARTRFTRLAAVMSMVGYIIGLGDRHCENILFYKKNGGVLHIDFDCLFEKGATLPTPEIVPFRLTQNLVDAMGICGYEGSFRATCEVTGKLLRAHEAPLMNILETLLYDPLLDWKSLQKPEVHLSKVRRKLRGVLDEKEGLPMNVNGQVDVLIQEARSVERLAQMYAGWSAYI